jgi:hypothetical protein
MPEDECFTLTHFIARAPYRTEVPLKAGYVWVTNDEPNVGAYADEFTELPGDSTVEFTDRASHEKPVLGFYLHKTDEREDGFEVVHEFSQWPRGRYIHVRFLEAHRPEGPRGPIAVQFIGLVGFMGWVPKQQQLAPLPVHWNVTQRRKQLCNPLHTDFTDLLNDRPCVVVVSESDLPERNNRLKAMMEAVSSHKALEGRKLTFFIWSANHQAHSRVEDAQLFADIERDMQTALVPPTAVLCDRPKGLFYHIGQDVPDITEQNLTQFCVEWAAGKLPLWKGSADIPPGDKDPDFPHTTVVVANSWDQIVMDTWRDVLLFVYNDPEPYTYAQFEKHDAGALDGLGPVGPPAGVRSVLYCLHKVAALVHEQERLVVAYCNVHRNWVPKEFLSKTGVVAFFPKDKAKMSSKQAPQKVPMQVSQMLQIIIDGSSEYASLQPLLEAVHKEEERRFLHRGHPEDKVPKGPSDANKVVLFSNYDAPLQTPTEELLDVTTLDEGSAAPVAPSFTYLVHAEMKIAAKDGQPFDCVAWNTDTDYLALGGASGRLCILRTQGDPRTEACSNQPMQYFFTPPADHIQFSLVAFGPLVQRMVTASSDGTVIVWKMRDDRQWEHARVFDRKGCLCTAMRFSPDESLIALCYDDGVISVQQTAPEGNDTKFKGRDAIPEWEEAKLRGIRNVRWAPDTSILLLGTECQVQVLDTRSLDFKASIMLHTGGRPTSSTALGLSLCGLAWHQARRAVQLEDLPVLALVFSNGLCQLMTEPYDDHPLTFKSEMQPTSAEWNPTGTYLAIGGLAAADSAPVVKLFSLTGTLRGQYTASGDGAVSQIVWQGFGNRLGLLVGGILYILRIKGKMRKLPPGVQEALSEPLQIVDSMGTSKKKMVQMALKGVNGRDGRNVSLSEVIDPFLERVIARDLSGSFITEQQISRIFAAMDHDGNGFVTKDEFRALYDYLDRFGLDDEVIEMEEALGMLSSIGDELLSYDELALLLLKLSKR